MTRSFDDAAVEHGPRLVCYLSGNILRNIRKMLGPIATSKTNGMGMEGDSYECARLNLDPGEPEWNSN